MERILLVVHHYPPRRVGGGELLTRRLAQWLSRHGIAVQVLCVEDIVGGAEFNITARDDLDGDVRVRRLNVSLAPGQELREWYDDATLEEQCGILLDLWQPELVHLVSGYLMGAAPLNAARARSIPTVVTLTDFWFLCPTIQLLRGDGSLCSGPEPLECARCLYDERRVFRALDERVPALVQKFWRTANAHNWLGTRFGLERRRQNLQARQLTLVPALNASDAIIALTQFAADLHIANGTAPEKITVKPDCLDLSEFDPIVPRSLHAGESRFGYFGQVTPVKGIAVLVRAFLKACADTGKRGQLDIYGATNAEPSFMDHLKSIAGDSPDIVFHGGYEHRRALALMHDLDAVVVPSLWYENSPRVIFEAFAAQRPVIGTRVGGIAEVVQDEWTGLLFERADVQDLARVLGRALEDPTLLWRLAQNIPPPRTLDEDMQDILRVYARVRLLVEPMLEAAL